MKIIEELKLKETINEIYDFKNRFQNISTFYENINSLNISSLQDLSFQKDFEFFDEVSFILSVISSIISHPHLSNRGEDIIIRADLARHVSSEAFKQMMKEPFLWKEQDLEMKPEYVHYYQYTDEIRIYENIFIGMLINLISNELSKYNSFYVSLIPSIDDNNQYLDSNMQAEALEKIQKLEKKIRFIKNTYFYKEVSKANLSLKSIQPTNILLKDRLYNFCFKFYRKFIKYEDRNSLFNDFKNYYFTQILKCFNKHHFALVNSLENNDKYLHFKYKNYDVKLDNDDKLGIILEINHNNIDVFHRLLLNIEKENYNYNLNETKDFISNNIISLWNIIDIINPEKPLFNKILKEEELVEAWVLEKFKSVYGAYSIYSKYCPVCKNKNIELVDDLFKCQNCQSIYTFKRGENQDLIWLIKVRR